MRLRKRPSRSARLVTTEGTDMAAEGASMDNKAHEKTYSGFITMFKVGTAISVIVAAIVVLLIAN